MSPELKEIINLVRKAGKKILEIYQETPKVYEKEDKSPVTEADLASEKIILLGLEKYGYGILSEETKDNPSRLSKEKIWIIDPLDGTEDFLQKTGEFSIMVGLVYKKEPVWGIVYKPVDDKMYFAEKGKGTYIKETIKPLRKIKVSSVFSLSDANFVFSRYHLGNLEKKFMEKAKIGKTTYAGSIGIKLGLISEGKADGYFTMSNKTCQWDICAPEIILKEAGGKVTNLKGENFIYNRQGIKNQSGIVASNKRIHSQIIKNINRMSR